LYDEATNPSISLKMRKETNKMKLTACVQGKGWTKKIDYIPLEKLENESHKEHTARLIEQKRLVICDFLGEDVLITGSICAEDNWW